MLLAFDFGLTRIGVACAQHVTRTASPLVTLTARRGKPDWGAVDNLIGQWQPSHLLVGLPLNMDGTVSEMAQRARSFAASLEQRYRLPVTLVDERLTSFEAHGLSADPEARHAVAACLIAETYFSGDS
ncbi:MAG: Holliday junction resolvase RuvX [Gammaproteobacteria bacterium]|nr:Holliday junction resolvase RuvX [Gammaproteobacteria bacterium]